MITHLRMVSLTFCLSDEKMYVVVRNKKNNKQFKTIYLNVPLVMMETNHNHIIRKEYLLFPTVNCDEQLNKTIKYPYGIHFCWKPMMSHGLHFVSKSVRWGICSVHTVISKCITVLCFIFSIVFARIKIVFCYFDIFKLEIVHINAQFVFERKST